MKACWLKMPVPTPGQLLKLTVIVDGVFFTGGFAVAARRMQNVVFGFGPDTDRRWSGTRFSGLIMKPANKLDELAVPALPISDLVNLGK